MLELAIAHELYARYPDFSEGRLAKIRSHVVSRASCAVVARELDLGAQARRGRAASCRPTRSSGSSKNRNVLAALLEAVLGALFLEHGFPADRGRGRGRVRVADRVRADDPRRPQDGAPGGARPHRAARSATSSSTAEGPPHERHFTCAAVVDGEQLGVGRGRTRRRRPSRRPPARRLATALTRRSRRSTVRHPGRRWPSKRPTNSELHLQRLEEEEEARREEEKGILELFHRDEDEPLARAARRRRPRVAASAPPDSLAGGASARRQTAWLQVLPGRRRGAPRAGRRRDRRPERLRQVERRRRDPLGRRLAQPERAARREAGRRPLRRRGQPRAGRLLRGRAPLRQRRRRPGCRVDYAELSITRRLHRGGEGQYLVNKTAVRRLDLVELLADLGLGQGMHSIIGQGKVEAILASKPEERRALIEEAAGLGRFKARRHRAELKLARVATQVERARDLEEEVRKRLRPLALQATAAERAEKLRGEIATLRARIAELDLATLDERLARGRRAARRRRVSRAVRPRRGSRRCSPSAAAPRRSSPTRPASASRRCRCSTGSAARPSGSGCGASPQPRFVEQVRAELADAETDAGDPSVEVAELEQRRARSRRSRARRRGRARGARRARAAGARPRHRRRARAARHDAGAARRAARAPRRRSSAI